MRYKNILFAGTILSLGLIILGDTVFRNTCGSSCGRNRFLDPLGLFSSGVMCPMACVEEPSFIFYIGVDLFVVLLIIWLVLLKRKILNRR